MEMQLSELAEKIGGQVEGDGSVCIGGVAGLLEAGLGDVSFVDNPKYTSYVADSGASAVIVNNEFQTDFRPLIRTDNPYLAFTRAVALLAAGVRHVDVAGAGGTSWVKVERKRSGAPEPHPFEAWGKATVDCVRQVAPLGFDTVVASGGVRTGLDAAKALALGADAVALALPVLRAWHRGGRDMVAAFLDSFLDELRCAMVLTGSRTVADLRGALE